MKTAENFNILVIGRQPEILTKVLELINKNNSYFAEGTLTDDDAITMFNTGQFNLVLLCQGIDTSSDKKLRHIFNSRNPRIKIIQHFGGGSGLLFNELQAAFDEKT
jgi:hypothetical protein